MKANTTKKPVIITESDKVDLKSVKIYKVVHRALKRHTVETEENMSEFVSQAIIEKLSK
jgi:hypothetical protein